MRRFLATLLIIALLAAGVPWLLARLARARVESAARARGASASWSASRLSPPLRMTFRDFVLIRSTGADTLFRADSMAVAIDPLSIFTFHPRLQSVALAHAAVRAPRRAAVDPDTLAPDEEALPSRSAARARAQADAAARARRLRESAEAIARMMAVSPRRLPRISLRDVTLVGPAGSESPWSAARVAALELGPDPAGVRLAARGTLQGEHEISFETELVYERNDRLSGVARFGIPEQGGVVDTLRVAIDGALRQDRSAGVITLADTSRVEIGELPLRLGGTIARRGPRASLRLTAAGLDQRRIQRSLPAAVLGVLADVGVRGTFDYRLALDLDLSQPDSVRFEAGVTPHGLSLDPARTRLPLLGLEQPFVASIHLPHDRIVTRDLSDANPFFRPLHAISPFLVGAVVTNEDGGFFRHRGFNPGAVREAIAENLKAGAFRRGAGTITMQLARNLWLGHERTLSRKFREVVLAWVLEHLTGLPKERLLEIYLNIIEWGPGVHGAAEAARFYFDRDAAELTVDESLFLATVVPAPSQWRYRFDAQGVLRPFARAQMHFIGRAMIAKGWLAAEQLPPADSLNVALRGPAREVLFPPADSLAVPPSHGTE